MRNVVWLNLACQYVVVVWGFGVFFVACFFVSLVGFFLLLFLFFPLLHLIMEHRAIIFIRPLNIYANSYVSNACHGGGISQLFLADCSSFLRIVFCDSVVTVPAPCLKWSLNIAIVVVCSATFQLLYFSGRDSKKNEAVTSELNYLAGFSLCCTTAVTVYED